MKKIKPVVTRNAYELADAIGLSKADAAEWEFRSNLNKKIEEIIKKTKITHAEVAKRMGTSRSRVTALLNGSRSDYSTDFLLRMLGAINYKIVFKVSRIA